MNCAASKNNINARGARLVLVLRSAFLSVLGLLGLVLASVSHADNCAPWVGKLVSVEGGVEVRRYQGSRWTHTSLGQTFCFGDRIRVGENARASVELSNDTILRLDQFSTLVLPEPDKGGFSFVDLLEGALHLISRVKSSLEIRTPFVNAGLEGTEFVVRILEGESVVSVIEGKVAVSNAYGRLSVTDGQTASAKQGSAPVMRLDLKPDDAVHWALYYPMIADPDAPGLAGNIGKAQRLLSVGRVAEAQKLVERLRTSDPQDSDALSIASIIALAQNRKDDALGLVEQALGQDSSSTAALLALSYIEQARFDLDAATAAVARAVDSSPGNALVWARLAELQSSLGDRRSSLASAQKAAELDPGLSRTQTVLGFSHLVGFDTASAKQTFRKAIELDSSDPLAFLGFGLAKIRAGDLAGGRRQVEIAVGLAPSNSLVRSYLGKAYLEEGRINEADAELNLAKQLDPLDPTPWLYDAYKQYKDNRPIPALLSLNESVELNSNRSVVRSSLLLDEDAAARSTSIGQIYRALGYERLAYSRAWRSLALDPTNGSAHLLLADTYSKLPRREVAQASKLVQAQLWLPLNRAPIRTQLVNASQSAIHLSGPANPSFDELNSLFLQDGASGSAEVFGGSNGTEGFQAAASYLTDTSVFGFGASRHSTDGYRDNTDYDRRAHQAYFRYDLSPDTNVQFNYRKSAVDTGQYSLFLNESAYDHLFRQAVDRERFTLMLKHSLSPEQDIAFSIFRAKNEDHTGEVFFPSLPFTVENDSVSRGYGLEFQHVMRADRFQTLSGIGYSHQDDDLSSVVTDVDESVLFMLPSAASGIQNKSGYVYGFFDLKRNLELLFGGSLDVFQSSTEKRSQFSPKFGFHWQVNSATALRGAAFRFFKKPLMADQTLEPVEIMGFDQYRDYANGVRGQSFGLALDHKMSKRMHSGVSLSRRKLREPVVGGAVGDRDEWLHSLYGYYLPNDRVTLGVEYQYERRTRESVANGVIEPIRQSLHVVPLSVGYFHPAGWFSRLETRFVRQRANFGPGAGADDETKFWLTDVAVGYRLPKGLGQVSLAVENVFDKAFRFNDVDSLLSTQEPRLPRFVPERTLRLGLKLQY